MMPHESQPLHTLADEAPAISPFDQPEQVRFPFSNDDSIQSFRDAERRYDTQGYAEAEHPVAVVIGESALLAHLPDIQEPTIVVLDDDVPALQHMRQYVSSARDVSNPVAWETRMGITEPSFLTSVTRLRYDFCRSQQVTWWQGQGETHPLDDRDLFEQRKGLLEQRAVIPWLGDVTNEDDMRRLGEVLRKHGATVTLLNLSNVIPYMRAKAEDCGESIISDAAGHADILAHLPLTDDVPILTTSRVAIGPADSHIVEATGPFYGLAHLREEGGDTKDGPIAQKPDSTAREEHEAAKKEHAAALVEVLRKAAYDVLGDLGEDWEDDYPDGLPTIF
ncbi:MAG TPA: hypothetical protein VHT70_03470 [Candidatus Saccharimonadales bacterium]|nr:hypothetical protein [Candidatus Saccharimonadales bacterium]